MSHALRAIRVALIIDDDEDILSLCEASLRAFTSWEVRLAESREEALRVLREGVPDVILLDMMMPGHDSLGLFAELKAAAATSGTPVVLMTAAPDVPEPWRQGAAGVITKPFDPATLADQLQRLMPSDASDASDASVEEVVEVRA